MALFLKKRKETKRKEKLRRFIRDILVKLLVALELVTIVSERINQC